MDAPIDLTSLIRQSRGGDVAASERLVEAAYGELHDIAQRALSNERRDHTLQATALANEAWLRLAGAGASEFQDRDHFLGAAAIAMRRILVNHALSRRALKRGGDRERVTIFEAPSALDEKAEDVAALEEALKKLEAVDARKGRIVELRFFGGLSDAEISRLLGVSTRTVEREWRFAKAWLRREIEKG